MDSNDGIQRELLGSGGLGLGGGGHKHWGHVLGTQRGIRE